MKAVVFDVGNVLIHWDVKALYRKLLPDDAAIDNFLRETDLLSQNVEFDRGLPFAEGIERLVTQFPHHAELLRAFESRWSETVVGPIEGSVTILDELQSAGVPLYAITNFSAETWPIAVQRFPFLGSHFIDVVVSGSVRTVKPDPAIYNLLFSRNGLVAEECLFIDDSLPNISGAQATGMQAIHFVGAAPLREALVSAGFLN